MKKPTYTKEELIQKTVELAIDLLNNIGELAKDERTKPSIEERSLKKFCNFAFGGYFSKPGLGRNALRISYNGSRVLFLNWQTETFDSKNCAIEIFSTDQEWQDAILRVIEKKSEYITRFKEANEKRAEKAAKEEDVQQRSAKGIREENARLYLFNVR